MINGDNDKDTFSQLFDCDLSSVNSPDHDIHRSALSLVSSSSCMKSTVRIKCVCTVDFIQLELEKSDRAIYRYIYIYIYIYIYML